MSAYVIVTRTGPVTDQAAMDEYNRQVMAGPRFEIEPLALYGQLQALEGEAPDGMVVLKFKTIEEAQAWYFSPEYQQASEHRKKAAPYTVTIVQGL